MRLHIGKAFNSLKLTDYLEEEKKNSKGTHLSLLLLQRHNMKGNDSTVQGKTKHTPT